MALLVRAASAFDFEQALDDRGSLSVILTRHSFAIFARQVGHGAACTIMDEADRLVMIAGLYPTGMGWAEAWWAVGPGIGPNLRRALRVWRALFEAVGADAAPLDVRAHIAADSVAGHRLAPLFGLSKSGVVCLPPHGDLTIWQRVF